MSNLIFNDIEVWRLNNKITSSHTTRVLLQCYSHYKHNPKIGMDSRFMVGLFPSDGARVQSWVVPSFKNILRTENAYSMTCRGKYVLSDLDNTLLLSGNLWNRAVEKNVTKYIDSL